MTNFNKLSENNLQLTTGVFSGVTSYETYQTGELLGIKLSEKNMLLTHAGELVPAYTENHRRKNKYSVEIYKNGMTKAVYLDEQQEVETPIGTLPAELITFYDSGEICRVFQLDGRTDGLWSEEEEIALAIPLSFSFPFGEFSAKVNSISFFKDGNIRSISLYPGEVITLKIENSESGFVPPNISKTIKVRNGFSLHQSGELESIEPAEPVKITTPIGEMYAYDPNAIGVNADNNSLHFSAEGKITELITSENRIALQTDDGHLRMFSPYETENPLDGENMITVGLHIAFDYESDLIIFSVKDIKSSFSISQSGFSTAKYSSTSSYCNYSDCSSCSMNCR